MPVYQCKVCSVHTVKFVVCFFFYIYSGLLYGVCCLCLR